MLWLIGNIIMMVSSFIALIVGVIQGDMDLQMLGIGLGVISIGYCLLMRNEAEE